MSHNAAIARDEARFLNLILMPSRSLSRRGFFILMSVIAVVSCAIGGFFLTLGAWPVFGFFGLDVALIYWAFRANFRDGRRSEHITMDKEHLRIKRLSPSHQEEHHDMSPNWVRVEIDRPVRHHSQLQLISHGQRHIIGAFLPPYERGEVADVIEAALKRRRAALRTL